MGFFIEKDHKMYNGILESDVKYWLAVEKGIFNPSQEEISKASVLLESGSNPDDIKSFCKLTGWKWKNVYIPV